MLACTSALRLKKTRKFLVQEAVPLMKFRPPTGENIFVIPINSPEKGDCQHRARRAPGRGGEGLKGKESMEGKLGGDYSWIEENTNC